jgi:hypothetical protein
MILQIFETRDVGPKEEVCSPDSHEQRRKKATITYGIDDVPPWYLTIFMALQVR